MWLDIRVIYFGEGLTDVFVADAASVGQLVPTIADTDASSVGHVSTNLKLLILESHQRAR